ncbi:YeiH family protein [Chitinimonas sp.]|uniref:YeiH family protein n=1 Tax=Chitinimonas sp. TaxID=1934313 RepID=UPI002F91E4BD
MTTTLNPPLPAVLPPSPSGKLPGLILAGLLALAALGLGRLDWLQAHGFTALTLAIVLGMLVGNTVYPRLATYCAAGVGFSKQTLLRLGVVLYGLRLTVQDIGQVGWSGVLVDSLVLGSTFALACYAGTRWLGLERRTAMLIGAGSAICGAAAVMATEPVVKARSEQVTVAVATVVVFGTLAIFLYPALYQLNLDWNWLPGGSQRFGIYMGSTIHEVAQVVAAGNAVSTTAADAAVIAKMVRVMLLAPFLIGLSFWLARGQRSEDAPKAKLQLPWFAVGFVAVVLFNSLQWLPAEAMSAANQLDTLLLATAMAALGLSTHLGAIRQAGLKPLLLAAILFAWLVLGGGAINLLAASLG